MTLLLTVSILTGRDGPLLQVSRLLGAAASLSESAGSAVGKAIDGATAIATSTTDLFLAVATNSMSLGDNAWHGVDLYDVNANRCSGSLTADSGQVLHTWLLSRHASNLLPCANSDLKQTLIAAATSVSLRMPDIQTIAEELQLNGTYGALALQAAVLLNGQVKVSFDAVNISFRPEWANPLWGHFGYDQEAKRTQIMAAIRDTALSLPSKAIIWHALQDDSVPLWSFAQGRFNRVLCMMWMYAFAIFDWVYCDLWGSGIFWIGALFSAMRLWQAADLRHNLSTRLWAPFASNTG